jgi:uncharacterized protein YutE (UPF0331/DUF86 family)/predicted nucleotidyltransferase
MGEQGSPGLEQIPADAGVAVAYLFGSRAGATARPDSDADIAILLARRLDLLALEPLADRLAQALGVPEVDLVVLDEASLELRGHVVQTDGEDADDAERADAGCCTPGTEPRRVAFETRTRSEWFDFQPRLAGRYLVQASAQTCIDVANHVIASEGWRVPRDHRDTFAVLEEAGVLDTALAARLRALAGLRSRLVRLYEDIDDLLVHEYLELGLADLSDFASAVAALVAEPESGAGPGAS